MSRIVLRRNAFRLVLTVVVLGSLFILAACGGGGGGPTPVTYDGLLTQATVTSTNAQPIFSAVWNGGSSSGSISLVNSSSTAVPTNDDMADVFRQLRDTVLASVAIGAGRSTALTAVAVDETYYGTTGFFRITGDMDPVTYTGTVTVVFSNYGDGAGFTIDGALTFTINNYDTTYDLLADGTMTFTLLTVKSPNSDISMTGTIHVQEDRLSNSNTIAVNMDGRDNTTRETFRFKQFVVITVYDNILSSFPLITQEQVSGRVYVKKYGYVDISTTPNPLTYLSSQDHPDGGGPLVLTGKNGTVAITPLSSTQFQIDVDYNGDASYDFTGIYSWE